MAATPPSPSTPTPASAAPLAGGAPPQGGAPPVAAISVPIPPNKPNEPAFQLKIEPDTRLEFKSDKLTEEPCEIEVKLTNSTKDRQAFKVKCTSNDIFRVRPSLGFCDAESSTPIKITFSSKTVPDSGRHYFAFYHMKNDEKEKTARQVWTPESKFEGVRRVMVYFLKSDGTPAPPTGNAPPASAPAGGAAQVAGTAAAAAADAKESPAAAK
uniref:Major sperm protein n=1 Tax=Elaeophora elaphi TaxID=1147741 RepID=A0A0R3RZW0_9BILA